MDNCLYLSSPTGVPRLLSFSALLHITAPLQMFIVCGLPSETNSEPGRGQSKTAPSLGRERISEVGLYLSVQLFTNFFIFKVGPSSLIRSLFYSQLSPPYIQIILSCRTEWSYWTTWRSSMVLALCTATTAPLTHPLTVASSCVQVLWNKTGSPGMLCISCFI